MTAATARTAARPRTWGTSGWAGTARPTTAWSRSPRCGPMSGSTTRCTPFRTRRPGTSPKGKNDPAFRTKLAIGAGLAVRARDCRVRVPGRAADSAYGDQDGFRAELSEAGLPFVMALKPRRGTWAYGDDAHTPVERPGSCAWGGAGRSWRLDGGDPHLPGRARRDLVGCRRDGSAGGDRTSARRLVVATADPGTLPPKATWYLVTNLPRPGGPPEPDSPHPAGGPGRDRPDLRHPALDRAGILASQGRAGLGRFPGPLGPRDPPPPGAGQLRVQLLLGRLVRPSGTAGPAAPRPGPGRGERGAARLRTAAGRRPGHGRCAAVRAWLSPWTVLQRWWTAWSKAPPPPQLQALISSLAAGHGLHLYIPT